MEQFSLEKYLENPSRKVVTRDGREVIIEKTDIHIHGMSHMILGKYSDIYEIWHSNGRINYTGSDCNLDLFFADEEELSEFEKALARFAWRDINVNDLTKEAKEILHKDFKPLLNLAREEIGKDIYDNGYRMGYDIGKEDALKSSPKWKKATEQKDLEKHIAILEENKVLLSNYLEEGDYYIDLEDLKTLPKEE